MNDANLERSTGSLLHSMRYIECMKSLDSTHCVRTQCCMLANCDAALFLIIISDVSYYAINKPTSTTLAHHH